MKIVVWEEKQEKKTDTHKLYRVEWEGSFHKPPHLI